MGSLIFVWGLDLGRRKRTSDLLWLSKKTIFCNFLCVTQTRAHNYDKYNLVTYLIHNAQFPQRK